MKFSTDVIKVGRLRLITMNAIFIPMFKNWVYLKMHNQSTL